MEKFYRALKKVARERIKKNYEMVFVNDGSSDKTAEILNSLFKKDKKLRVVHLFRNFGQSAALQAGIDQALGEMIVTLDGDLQHDPRDIPKLVAKLEEGYDLVCGWRKERKDNLILRKTPSRIANWAMRKLTGLRVHDFGTTLRAYRADLIREVKIYSELHRFAPVLASEYTTRITEVPIKNPPRVGGKSKYNLGRTKRVLLDLITVPFLTKFFARPMQIFGVLTLLCEGLAFLGLIWLIHDKFILGESIKNRPLLLAMIFTALLGVQFLTLGLIGEMLTRSHFQSAGKKIYKIREMKG